MKKLAIALAVLIVMLCMAIPSFAADGYGIHLPLTSGSSAVASQQYFALSNILDSDQSGYSLAWNYSLAVVTRLRLSTLLVNSAWGTLSYYVVPYSNCFGYYTDITDYFDAITSDPLLTGTPASTGSYVDIDVSGLAPDVYFLVVASVTKSYVITGFMFTRINSGDIVVVESFASPANPTSIVDSLSDFSSRYPYARDIVLSGNTESTASRYNYLYLYFGGPSVSVVYSPPTLSCSSIDALSRFYSYLDHPATYSLRLYAYGSFYSWSTTFSTLYMTAVYSPDDKDSYDLKQDIVDALDDPSFGSTDSAGEALGSATENAGNVLSSGSSKEDSIVSEALAGADTSQFDSVIQDTSLLAGLSFWKGFLEFTYDNLQFFKVLLGLCISVGTIALVVGVSGRVKRYISSRKGDGEE